MLQPIFQVNFLCSQPVFWKGVLEELLWFIKVRVLLLLEAACLRNTSLRSQTVSQAVVAHAFIPSTRRGRWIYVSSSSAWFTERVPGQAPKLHRETLSQKNKTKKEVVVVKAIAVSCSHFPGSFSSAGSRCFSMSFPSCFRH